MSSAAVESAPVEEAPPLPSEDIPALPDEAPPLPDEVPPDQADDGWEPVWDAANQAFYFYNRFTKATQWENPRVPDASSSTAPGIGAYDRSTDAFSSSTGAPGTSSPAKRAIGGYNPAIHGDYDPTADYAIEAQEAEQEERRREAAAATIADPNATYEATGQFNRFTGRWQADGLNPDNYNDESKSRRQMHAFFDVDAAANSHDGRSLKAERSGKKLSKAELKAFQEKRRNKKEEKRRAWLRD